MTIEMFIEVTNEMLVFMYVRRLIEERESHVFVGFFVTLRLLLFLDFFGSFGSSRSGCGSGAATTTGNRTCFKERERVKEFRGSLCINVIILSAVHIGVR